MACSINFPYLVTLIFDTGNNLQLVEYNFVFICDPHLSMSQYLYGMKRKLSHAKLMILLLI